MFDRLERSSTGGRVNRPAYERQLRAQRAGLSDCGAWEDQCRLQRNRFTGLSPGERYSDGGRRNGSRWDGPCAALEHVSGSGNRGNSGKCLDVRAFSTDAGAAVQQWSCTGGANQQWLFIAAADGSYQVQSVNSGMSLNVDGDSSSNGTPVIQWPYSGTPNENWQLEPTGDGYYTLVVESTGKCLDVNGGPSATGDGIVVQQWDCWGGSNQAWQLVSNSGVTHSVTLTWNPSTSSNVAGYYVYRGSTSGGPYNKLSSLLSSDSYVDGSVQAGQSYFYVTTAADSSGDESAYSNEVQATIPSP